MANLIYISRNYTEFGPFTPAEILDFSKRNILRSNDHVRYHGHNDWLSVGEWTAKADILSIISKPITNTDNSVKRSEPSTSVLAEETGAAPPVAKKTVKKAAKKAPAKKTTKSK